MFRPGTSGTQYGYGSTMRPPSSGAGAGFGAGPGTATRGQGSSWAGTQAPAAGMGVALNTGVEVAARPVMREGMKGMHMQGSMQGAAGPRRQVLDRSYHLGQLRAKITELVAELERLKQEEERFQKNSGNVAGMIQKQKGLEAEVMKAKSDLSDLNYAVEKSAGGVDIDKINEQAAELREQNKEHKQQTDLKFMDRQKCEEKLKIVQQEVDKLTVDVEERLQKEPAKRAEYYKLREESATLAANLHMQEKHLIDLGRRYEEMQMRMKSDPQKQQQFHQQEKVHRMRKERDDLQKEFQGDMQQEKADLLGQVKADVQEIELIQSGIREAKGELEDARGKLQELEKDLSELTGDKMGKYKQLEQRDQEMQAFIDNFESERQKQLDQNRMTEESVVHLLEHIGDKLKQGSNMPNRLSEMREELAGKQKAVGESTSTHERLKNELELRKKELEKVNNLDEKITGELAAITKKIQENEAAMKKFSDLEGLRQEHEDRKRRLIASKNHLGRLKEHLKQQVVSLNYQYEAKRDEMQKNEVHLTLQQAEQKIRQIRHMLFRQEDVIKQKQSETQYLPIKAECMRTCESINEFLKDPKRLEKTYSRGRAF
eukprot:TRINITY_DN50022_c0_g1_i1.p1 TRINITY_DN50022_c0_g1~~TRINITY_DN50022_c0_g1_i1.p1  ORF type:complete len:631 (+),score=358.83 TRINITY_DN50022_c0_g1_i1:91-1893(+)